MKKTKNAVAVTTVMLCVCVMPFAGGCAQERADNAEISLSVDEVVTDYEKAESNNSVAEISNIEASSVESNEEKQAPKDAQTIEDTLASEEVQEIEKEQSSFIEKDTLMQLPEGSFDEVNVKLSALQDWMPESQEDEDLKWSMYGGLMELQAEYAEAGGELYKIRATTEDLLLYVDYRIENDEMMIRQKLDSDGAIANELEKLKVFREEVANSDPSELRDLWNKYWEELLSQEPPSEYVFD